MRVFHAGDAVETRGSENARESEVHYRCERVRDLLLQRYAPEQQERRGGYIVRLLVTFRFAVLR